MLVFPVKTRRSKRSNGRQRLTISTITPRSPLSSASTDQTPLYSMGTRSSRCRSGVDIQSAVEDTLVSGTKLSTTSTDHTPPSSIATRSSRCRSRVDIQSAAEDPLVSGTELCPFPTTSTEHTPLSSMGIRSSSSTSGVDIQSVSLSSGTEDPVASGTEFCPVRATSTDPTGSDSDESSINPVVRKKRRFAVLSDDEPSSPSLVDMSQDPSNDFPPGTLHIYFVDCVDRAPMRLCRHWPQ